MCWVGLKSAGRSLWCSEFARVCLAVPYTPGPKRSHCGSGTPGRPARSSAFGGPAKMTWMPFTQWPASGGWAASWGMAVRSRLRSMQNWLVPSWLISRSLSWRLEVSAMSWLLWSTQDRLATLPRSFQSLQPLVPSSCRRRSSRATARTLRVLHGHQLGFCRCVQKIRIWLLTWPCNNCCSDYSPWQSQALAWFWRVDVFVECLLASQEAKPEAGSYKPRFIAFLFRIVRFVRQELVKLIWSFSYHYGGPESKVERTTRLYAQAYDIYERMSNQIQNK